MTLRQMREAMPNNEYHQWRAFYAYRATVNEHAAQTGDMKMIEPD